MFHYNISLPVLHISLDVNINNQSTLEWKVLALVKKVGNSQDKESMKKYLDMAMANICIAIFV